MPNSWKFVLNTYSLSSHKKFMSNSWKFALKKYSLNSHIKFMSNSWKFVFFDVMDNANK